MDLNQFGMDTMTLAGSLEAKLKAVSQAGFSEIVISPRDIVSHPEGEDAAIAAVRESGVRATAVHALRDFEGLSGELHAYKLDVAKAMLRMCHAVGSKLLLVASSTSAHASGDADKLAQDLGKLATLAVPLGIRVAYKALSWGTHVREYPHAWNIIDEANRANLGLALDSYQLLVAGTGSEELEFLYPERIFLVQLADFMQQEIPSIEEKIDTARHFRVFPGEGVHSAEIAALVRSLDQMGYGGTYSFNVINDDYLQLPASMVTERARAAARWLAGQTPSARLPRLRPAAK